MKGNFASIVCLVASLALAFGVPDAHAARPRSIRKVAPVRVETPQGTAPRLPWQVWVKYSDGFAEWRQVRWSNSDREMEQWEAELLAGSLYRVRGYVVGDNTTGQGYPITAEVRVVDRGWLTPAPVPVAHTLPLSDVRLTGSNRLTSNRDLDVSHLLSLDVAQQLYNYRDTYGLSTEGYPQSDGWDSPTTKLKGHGSGHYMSALAFAYAGTDDQDIKTHLKSNIKRMVDELRMCQERTFVWSDSLGRYWEARDLAPGEELGALRGTWADFDGYKQDWQHYGYGYLNAIPAQHPVMVEMYRPYNNDQWLWAPYYVIHKELAGLIDIADNVDDVRTRHANQHIPMVTGALRSYRGNSNPYYYHLAVNFWNMVQGRYAYAMGGVGNAEMFRQPYTQMRSMATNVRTGRDRQALPDPALNETCCSYNLAKLTKDLNCYDPDDARYMDYYERVLYNQIVGSLHPEHYGVTYQYAVGMDARKPFGNETPQSSCCGGTGSENHVKYQEAAYFVSDECLWVALYLPTTARWREKGITLHQECSWPAERSEITIVEGEGEFALKLRVPYWATSGFAVRLNGKLVAKHPAPCSYVEIPARKWVAGDRVEVSMPFAAHVHWGPDKMSVAATGAGESATPFEPQWLGALMYGPLVMATPDVRSWSDADVTLSGDLGEVELLGATEPGGTDGSLYTMKLGDMSFQPDYWQTGHSTHYLRLNVQP